MSEIEETVPFEMRRTLERAGIPHSLLYDSSGLYLAAWVVARRAGKKLSVAEACSQAGITPEALRKRRQNHPSFAAAERWARSGEPYVAPAEPETIKAIDHGPGKPLVEGATRTFEIFTPPAPLRAKRKPRRYWTPPP